MSKTASPTSVTTEERICQAYGRRVDCELKFEQLKRMLNNRVTERSPSLENVMLGRDMKPFPTIEPFQGGNDPAVKAHNAIVTGMIAQRVKDEAERNKAIVTTKASILTWLHESFEDYISSSAEPARRVDWDDNKWPDIVKHIRNWYLEPVSQCNDALTHEEQERLMRDYRQTRQSANQTLSEWETIFKRLVTLANEKAYANKRDLEQARDFVDKLLGSSYGNWKHECLLEENRQQQRIACGETREKAKGYPQSLEEAIQRAKVVERQNHLREQKKEERDEFANREHTNQSTHHTRKKSESYSEFNAFARTREDERGKYKQYTIQELRDMPRNTSAKSIGIRECRICKREKKPTDHIFVHCIDELKMAKQDKKADQRNLMTSDNDSATAILAKVELAYKLGQAEGLKNAQEANKFLAAATNQQDDASNYSRQAQYRFMNRTGPFSKQSIPRSMTQKIRAILDTGSSGNDFPTWIIKELDCEEIANPLAHIPINTVLGQYYCQVLATVPILEQVSTSENSNFIILAFDVIQNNPMIRTSIELNRTNTKLESVTLTFPVLHNLQIKFTFEGRTLMANANELVNALRYHIVSTKTNPHTGTPLKSATQSLTDFLDRLITGHLTQHPEEAKLLKDDPAVKELDYFGRNPEKDPEYKEHTRLHNLSTPTP